LVSELLHEKRALTPEMAARIAKLLRTTPESWLRMQAALDEANHWLYGVPRGIGR
jgi:antitoxin HigA-1